MGAYLDSLNLDGADMNETKMQHGHDWQGQDLAGWIASEKFDGCRAYWDGAALWSRGGLAIPNHWGLPDGVHLDGEIYAGISGSRKVAAAIRSGRFDDSIRFVAFDAPSIAGDYLARYTGIDYGDVVGAVELRDTAQALHLMRAVQMAGGEGLMVRHPELSYHPGRTSRMLKVKHASL
jgi:DNA ligase 1